MADGGGDGVGAGSGVGLAGVGVGTGGAGVGAPQLQKPAGQFGGTLLQFLLHQSSLTTELTAWQVFVVFSAEADEATRRKRSIAS